MDSSQRSKSSGNVFWFMEDDWTTFAVLTSFSGGCVHNRSLKNPQNLQSGKLFFFPSDWPCVEGWAIRMGLCLTLKLFHKDFCKNVQTSATAGITFVEKLSESVLVPTIHHDVFPFALRQVWRTLVHLNHLPIRSKSMFCPDHIRLALYLTYMPDNGKKLLFPLYY